MTMSVLSACAAAKSVTVRSSVSALSMSGTAVKRTLVTTTTSVTYTGAQQIADRSALLGLGDALDVRIYQLSALVGRGAPESVTLQF